MIGGVKIEWHAAPLHVAVKSKMDKVSKEVAHIVMKDAQRILRSKAKTKSEHGLLTQFDVQPSKYKDGGYLVYCQGPGNWHEPYHASFVEMGSSIHPYGNKKRTKVKIDAKPFLRPAARKNKRKANRMFQDALDKL